MLVDWGPVVDQPEPESSRDLGNIKPMQIQISAEFLPDSQSRQPEKPISTLLINLQNRDVIPPRPSRDIVPIGSGRPTRTALWTSARRVHGARLIVKPEILTGLQFRVVDAVTVVGEVRDGVGGAIETCYHSHGGVQVDIVEVTQQCDCDWDAEDFEGAWGKAIWGRGAGVAFGHG